MFTIVIELGMPYISAVWQEELAGVVYGETRWQAHVICGVDMEKQNKPIFCQNQPSDIHRDSTELMQKSTERSCTEHQSTVCISVCVLLYVAVQSSFHRLNWILHTY